MSSRNRTVNTRRPRASWTLVGVLVAVVVAQQGVAAVAAAAPAPAVPAATADKPRPKGATGPVAEPCQGVSLRADQGNATWMQLVDDPANRTATFCFQGGRYKNFSVTPWAGQRFIGRPGVILDGAVRLPQEGFTRVGTTNVWSYTNADLVKQAGYVWRSADCRASKPACELPEDLFISGARQTRVASLDAVRPGTYYYPRAEKSEDQTHTIYIGRDPSVGSLDIQLASTEYAFKQHSTPQADVTIANLVIERYASGGHFHTVGGAGKSPNWTVRNNEVRFNHGGGISTSGGRVLNNFVHHNGHQGISGSGGENGVVEGNEISYNNIAGYEIAGAASEGGAGKFSVTKNLHYLNNWVHHNYGQGAWFDIDNENTWIENNLVEQNEGVGIMFEISKSATIKNNTVRDNGHRSTEFPPNSGMYVYSAGILVSSSTNVDVVGNTVVAIGTKVPQNAPYRPLTSMGIVILQGNRDKNCAWGCDSQHNTVTDNTIRYTYDIVDQPPLGNGISGSGVVQNGQPENLLDNTFANNTYVMPDCQRQRWHWVTKVGEKYQSMRTTLTDAQKKGQDTGSVCYEPAAG